MSTSQNQRLAPKDYTDERTLKTIGDFLGFAGWYTARGVSQTAYFIFSLVIIYVMPCEHASCDGIIGKRYPASAYAIHPNLAYDCCHLRRKRTVPFCLGG